MPDSAWEMNREEGAQTESQNGSRGADVEDIEEVL